jgi:hypothetical protein
MNGIDVWRLSAPLAFAGQGDLGDRIPLNERSSFRWRAPSTTVRLAILQLLII